MSSFSHNKTQNDFFFEIGGCLFPLSIHSLLTDDQKGCAA